MSGCRWRLNSVEFRGFALCDLCGPLIFVSSKDAEAVQMFTLAQIWLGASTLSNLGAAYNDGVRRKEIWCNAVVADYCFVAHALAHECIVVTHEGSADTSSKIKIPNAFVGVRCMNRAEMLRRERAKLALGTGRAAL